MGRITFGDRDMQRAVRRYGDDVINQVKRIVAETASIIHANAKALAPVDDGNLRDSISMELNDGGLSAVVRVTAFYSIFVEFGTGVYAVGPGGGRQTPWTYYSDKLNRFVTTRGQAPQPYWFPALDIGERYFKSEIRKLG